MLTPAEFARAVVRHGTVGVVADPHEIANVLGIAGVQYMKKLAREVSLKTYISAPSCVPATTFETSGAEITADDIEILCLDSDTKSLGEVMNFPGVVNGDVDMLRKIEVARSAGKIVDGHAPLLSGIDLIKYVDAGITTDHECSNLDEAIEKLNLGMKVWIREGSAARNFNALYTLIDNFYKNVGFCSDDKHPDDLLKGHINKLVVKAIEKGQDLFKTLYSASATPILHYNLDIGMLRKGDSADFVLVEDLKQFSIRKTVIDGSVVFEDNKSKITVPSVEIVNNFNTESISIDDILLPATKDCSINVIVASDGELLTESMLTAPNISNGNMVSDIGRDLLKIVVVNRYEKGVRPSVAFIHGFGLKRGAIASSVAHDSHNIIAVGVTDDDIVNAINIVIKNKGGVSAVDTSNNVSDILALPVGGLMSDKPIELVASKYEHLNVLVSEFGSKLKSPYMTLSFMALLVIPSLKLSDKGLFDSKTFNFIELQNE
jgi:adenine deaminase